MQNKRQKRKVNITKYKFELPAIVLIITISYIGQYGRCSNFGNDRYEMRCQLRTG